MPQFSGMYSGPDRREFDAYHTEFTLIDKFLEEYGSDLYFNTTNERLTILDPCSGPDCRWGLKTKEYLETNHNIN